MGLNELYEYYWIECADQRVIDWFLMRSPFPMLAITFAYIYFVLGWGPQYMKNREAYSLKRFIQCYNLFQIVANMWMVYSFVKYGWFTEISVYCESMNYTTEPGPLGIARTIWWMVWLKVADLTETVVFVLRKRHRQISFLHLYHHVSTLLVFWVGVRYIGGGMASFMPLGNSFVHVIMYTYYFLSTLGPFVRKTIAPFKPVVTVIQMTQLVIFLVHMMQSQLPSCPVPKWPARIIGLNVLMNLILFYNFYKDSYVKTKVKTN